jgi:hypothetical protein
MYRRFFVQDRTCNDDDDDDDDDDDFLFQESEHLFDVQPEEFHLSHSVRTAEE